MALKRERGNTMGTKHSGDSHNLKHDAELTLSDIDTWLHEQGLKQKTIDRHLESMRFFLLTYLPTSSARTVADGCKYATDFLGYFLLRKCADVSVTSMKQDAASLKKLYRYLVDMGRLDWEPYNEMCSAIKRGLPQWLDALRALDEQQEAPSLDDFLHVDNDGFLTQLYAAVRAEMDKGGLWEDFDPDDFDPDDFDRTYPVPTRQEAINELTLALLYLTSRKEEAFKGSGMQVRRAARSLDRRALTELHELGFIDAGRSAGLVTFTDEGTFQAEESLQNIGLEHLIDSDEPDFDAEAATRPDAGETHLGPGGWKVIK